MQIIERLQRAHRQVGRNPACPTAHVAPYVNVVVLEQNLYLRTHTARFPLLRETQSTTRLLVDPGLGVTSRSGVVAALLVEQATVRV